MTTIETSKLPRAPTFLGAMLYIFAGMLFGGTGIGMTLIGPPSYYPGAVWNLIIVLYFTIAGVILGLGARRLHRYLYYLEYNYPDTGESGEPYDIEHATQEEDLREEQK